jgi:hypothetical protein
MSESLKSQTPPQLGQEKFLQSEELTKALSSLREFTISVPSINLPKEWREVQESVASAGTAIELSMSEFNKAVVPAIQAMVSARNSIAHLNLGQHFEAIQQATKSIELAAAKTAAIGKSSELSQALRSLGSLPADERRETSKAANTAQSLISAVIKAREVELEGAELDARLKAEHPRPDPALASAPQRFGPSDHAGHGRDDRRLRRHGLRLSPKARTSRTTSTTSPR